MRFRQTLLALPLCFAFAMPAFAADDAAGFISKIGDKGMTILRSNEDLAHRKADFSAIFKEDFDVPAIAKFVLGRYWRTATPQQQQDYLSVFGQYVVAVYAERFANYSGDFKVLSSPPADGNMATVHSEFIQAGAPNPVMIDWVVAKEGDTYKILNVLVENLSMSTTQRDEFAAVIQQNGGNVQALIDQLKAKVANG